MGAFRRTYHKIACEHCGRDIGRNNYGVHLRTCAPAKEAKAKMDTEKAQAETIRIKTAPIETLTIGEVMEAGREAELYAEREMRRMKLESENVPDHSNRGQEGSEIAAR